MVHPTAPRIRPDCICRQKTQQLKHVHVGPRRARDTCLRATLAALSSEVRSATTTAKLISRGSEFVTIKVAPRRHVVFPGRLLIADQHPTRKATRGRGPQRGWKRVHHWTHGMPTEGWPQGVAYPHVRRDTLTIMDKLLSVGKAIRGKRVRTVASYIRLAC